MVNDSVNIAKHCWSVESPMVIHYAVVMINNDWYLVITNTLAALKADSSAIVLL